MARIVARKPVIGIVSGLLFGALGWLLIGIAPASVGATRLAPLLFSVAGYFFLFVAAMAFVAAVLALLRSAKRR